jgi:acyl-CoA synthetase (AMP-forming)/AMP-acid ligase II
MSDKVSVPVNLLDKLNQWANETPDRKAWTFLNDKGDLADSYTYKVKKKLLLF